MNSPPPPTDERAAQQAWRPLSASERESFFDAIARYQRSVWRVTAASLVANGLVAVILAALMAPLFYGAFGLVLDVINILIPMPNLFAGIMNTLSPMLDNPEKVSAGAWLHLIGVAALPGLAWMVVVVLMLRRMLLISATFDAGDMGARPPNPAVLAEQRFGNVITEMAVAANLAAPRVLVVDRDLLNAAVFGRDEQHVTIIVSQGLLQRLDRAEMQGVAAHLLGSVANGDMQIGLRAAVTLSLFGLIAYLGTILTKGEGAGRKFLQLIRTTFTPTAAGARRLADELADPFVDADAAAEGTNATAASAAGADAGAALSEGSPARPAKGVFANSALGQRLQSRWEKIRPFMWLPLAGPVVMSGFFGGMVSSFVLSPLLALAWRQRKYMADATAVRLTRDPNTLGEALEKMSAAGAGSAFAPWTAHLSVVPLGKSQTKLLGGGVVPMFPSLERRLRSLGKLGAHVTGTPRQIPLKA
ncbi:MAG: M48 family metalloprotease, partial [Gammaproteobacteria bacterium]